MSSEIGIVAGFDSSGGAGVTVDGETVRHLGATPRFAVTALTAQGDEAGFFAEPVSSSMLKSQLEAVFSGAPGAIKIGMLPNRKSGVIVANALQTRPDIPVVFDPVLASSSGLVLMEENCIQWVRDEFMARVTVLTPNLDEARRFTGVECASRADMERAGEIFLSHGVRAVLIKGGHLLADTAADCLMTREGSPAWLESPRVDGAFRGTGCRLSSALATRLARGDELPDAVSAAKAYLTDYLHQRAG